MDTAGTNGNYYFSSWGYGDRVFLRDLYKRYAFSKVHIMKKIEQSGRGRSCGHWPMWRAMAKALLSEVRRRISPKDLENFFWDVLAEGSDVTATLDQLLDCRHAVGSPRVRSRAVVPKLDVKPVRRSAATTFAYDSDGGGGQQKTTLLDEQGAVALFEPTTVEGGAGAPTEFALLPASGAGLDNDMSSALDLMLAHISIPRDCQLDVSTSEYAFLDCPEDAGLVGVGPMFSDGSGSPENADSAAVVRRIIAGASPEPTPPPVQRVDQGVQCELDSTLLFKTMQRDHLLRMEALRRQRDAFLKQIED